VATNTKWLIDLIVRQTTVLVGELATAAGIRAPLAHVADQVFLELSNELANQGVSRKVAADMFGLALRSYQAKVRRLSESATERDRSLWEGIYSFINDEETANRADILREFHADDQKIVKGILHDMVESGLVFKTGTGDSTTYRAVPAEDVYSTEGASSETREWLVWVTVHRHGPLTASALENMFASEDDPVDNALDNLVESERLVETEIEGEPAFEAKEFVIPLDDPAGWEAALYDHFNALVRSMCVKLRGGGSRAQVSDNVGGSTYTFVIWDGHPFEEEILNLLSETRERVSELRERSSQFLQRHGEPEGPTREVTFYFGQSVIDQTDEEPT